MKIIKNINIIEQAVNFVYGLAGDPPHIGHIQAIKHLLSNKHSTVWIVLSVAHAYGKKTAPYEIRKKWLNILLGSLLTEDEKSRIIFKDVEKDILSLNPEKQAVYSIDLKDYFILKYPDQNFIWAFGEDNANEESIKKFKDYEKIVEWDILSIPEYFKLHSTDVRKAILSGNYEFLKESLTEELSTEIISWVGKKNGKYWINNRDI